jgi:hypothetical protein
MKLANRDLRALLLLLLTQMLADGCQGEKRQLSEQDEIAIYQAVIRRIYESDGTFGGTLEKPTLYLIRATDDAAGDPSRPQSNSVVLSEPIQQGIAAALADLPTKVIWVDNIDQVSLDADTGQVSDKGRVITLGNNNPQNADKVLVSASIYVANLAVGGGTYVVELKDGLWMTTGTTGVHWISKSVTAPKWRTQLRGRHAAAKIGF